MADLKVCDRCGKRIDIFNRIRAFINPVWYRYAAVDGTAVCYELCPECHKEVVEFIKNGKEDDQ